MQRYFLKKIENGELFLHEQDIHHIIKVMRCKINDKIETVFDNKIYLCNIDSLNPFSISIIKEYKEDRDLKIDLTIAISLVSEQKFDLILQKLTELGVTKIIPIMTERSIVKLDKSKMSKKYQRWETICKEASEQSHRTNIPQIEEVITLEELKAKDFDLKLLCSLAEQSKSIKEVIDKNFNNIKNILFVIGPEGGFSSKEETNLINNKFISISLGKRVLRVETAAIYVASIINYIYG